MKKGDIIILLIILSISIIVSITFKRNKNIKTNETYAVVKVKGEVVKKIQMNKTLNEAHEFKFGKHSGAVEIKDKKVRMLKMSRQLCPRGICSNTGWISEGYQMIVCLPNGITIEIEEIEEDYSNEIDAIAF